MGWTIGLNLKDLKSTVLIHQEYSHAYPSLIFDVDISSFLDKAFHCVVMAIAGCSMQWSPLMERNIHFKDIVGMLDVVI